MKVLMITFSITNAGDFLIEDRLKKLIHHHFSDCDIVETDGFSNLLPEYVNNFDVLVMGGGPYLDDRILEDPQFKVFTIIEEIKIPIFFVGVGTYGSFAAEEYMRNKTLSEKSQKILRTVLASGGQIGCRDVVSWKILRNMDIQSVLSGCPAWYDLIYLNENSVKKKQHVEKIVISDPGVTKVIEEQDVRADQAIAVVNAVQAYFPDAVVCFTFNNGIDTKYSSHCNQRIRSYLEKNNIKYYNLAKDKNGFSIYDDMDLHIGFRVHSHIYALSHRIPSLMIEEDLRGYGMNETLGLPHIFNYGLMEGMQKKCFVPNSFLIRNLVDEMKIMTDNNYYKIESAYRDIQNIYKNGFIGIVDQIKCKAY